MKEKIKNNILLLFMMLIGIGILALFMHIIINTYYYTEVYYEMKNYHISIFAQGAGRTPCVTKGVNITQKFTSKNNSLNQINILFLQPNESTNSNINVKIFEEKSNKKIFDGNVFLGNLKPNYNLKITFENQKFSKNKEYRIEILGLDGEETNSIQFPYGYTNNNISACQVNGKSQNNALVIDTIYAGMLNTKEQCIVFGLLAILLSILIVLFDMQKYVLEKLELNPKIMLKNIISNWYLTVSMIAFYLLNIRTSEIQYSFLSISIFVFILVTSQFNSLFSIVKKSNKYLNLYSFLSTLGICFYLNDLFCNNIENSILSNFFLKYNIQFNYTVIGIVLTLISSIVIFLGIQAITKYLINLLKNVFTDISKKEWFFYGILFLLIVIYVVFVSINTTISYGVGDALYTSDSDGLVLGNAYLNIYHSENDMRQPLFAVFAMPFIGIAYLFSLVLPNLVFVKPLCINLIQIVMLLATTIILSKLLNFNAVERVLFVILSFCTYTFLLFTIMMEQYIVAYFWLITFIYLVVNQKQDVLALSATSGTLVTGLILSPFIVNHFHWKDYKEIVSKITKCVLTFVMLIIIFNRIDILEDIFFKERIYESFVDENITILDKT